MAEAAAPAPVRVLVVDDHELFREAARAVVCATPGFETVAETPCGFEALDLTELLHPDVVLLDLDMTEPDGIDTARRIIAREAPPLVVLVSLEQDHPRAMSEVPAGPVVFVRKQDLRPTTLSEVWARHVGHPARVTPAHPRRAESRDDRANEPKGAP